MAPASRAWLVLLLASSLACFGCGGGGGGAGDASGDAAADGSPDGAGPDGATPDGATPDGATPDGATPDGSTPDGSTPDGSTDGSTADGSVADGGGTTCDDNGDCGRAQWCAGEGCATPGVCEARPRGCSRELDPVCGCDDMTYSNPCLARSAGVRIKATGRCDPTTRTCMGAADCGDGSYCMRSDCAGTGTCTAASDICLDIFDPVCGCDDMTYSNACRAHASGVEVATDSACGDGTPGI